MSKLRVAFFIDSWRPGSGTENQLKGMLDHFDPSLVEAELFTLRNEIPPDLRREFPCPVTCLGVGSLLSPKSILGYASLVSRLRKGRFDVAMIYFVDSNLYMVPACRWAGIESIVINRRDMGYWYEPGILKKLQMVNRAADYFLANSQAVKNQVILHEGFQPERIHVLPNGIWNAEVGYISQSRETGSNRFNLPLEKRFVGITASLRPVKRVDRFLQVAAVVSAAVSDVHFLVAGKGGLLPELQGQAEKLGIGSRVHFLGQVDDVPNLLAKFDIGVLTSESEGLSNSLMEYALAGVPAVTFDTGGNKEVVMEGETGFLVQEGDTDAMAGKVIDLLEDSSLRTRMAQRGREECLQRFSSEKIMAEIMTFLKGIHKAGRRNYYS
ncbi:MAG: hypothetical protein DRI24_19210 [Deltaproteobacteria bacterium]|nr:MAG: hypothetical protein DRI24_19210 [Deltaproteobacteria bacterium]